MGLHEKGWIPKKISEHLNALGVNSWSGKQFYSALVFGIIRKARLKTSQKESKALNLSIKLINR
jgi:hypothetical protein